eukprot:5070143-Ditylum_brightwellii.AAC.1
MAVAPADIHYHLKNPARKEAKFHCFVFVETLAASFIQTDWHQYCLKQTQSDNNNGVETTFTTTT